LAPYAMRHLEHAGEDKFWEAWIKDETTLFYRFGKIGAQGQTRVKRFATRAEAEADLDENVERKRAEGFKEKGADAAEKKEEAAKAPEPKRSEPRAPKVAKTVASAVKPEQATAARNAVEALQKALGGRSWKVQRLGRRARQAFERIAGADPAKVGFGDAFDALMQQVVATEKRLPLEVAVQLLCELDPAVFVRTVKQWKGAGPPAKDVVAALAASAEGIHDASVALRVGAALADRQLDAASWRKRFHHVKPELEESLKGAGTTFARWLKSLDGGDDSVLAGRLEEAAK
jgi:predicted DNA-binding WGR domain protein